MIKLENHDNDQSNVNHENAYTPKKNNRLLITGVAVAVLIPVITLGSCAIRDTVMKHNEVVQTAQEELMPEPQPVETSGDTADTAPTDQVPGIIPQGEDWDGQQNQQTSIDAYIMIPEYEHLYVSHDNPFVWFNNPEQNEGIAYFRYVVKEDDDVLYGDKEEERIWIEAGKAAKVNMADRLGSGDHELTLCISTCDPQTGEPLNGAEIKAAITIEK